MRVGIDCRLAGAAHAGIGRYIENLVRQVLLQQPHQEWILFFYDQKQAQAVLAQEFDRLHKAGHIIYVPIRHYSVAEQLRLPKIFGDQKLDVLHVPHFNVPVLYQGKVIVTIHDLLWHEYRGAEVTTLKPWLYWFKYAAYRWVATQAITKAAAVLVPAETIKKTLERHYPTQGYKVLVTKEGSSVEIRPQSTSPSLSSRELLYVGSLYPHKNVKVVIEALKKLPEHSLLIAGSRTVFQDQLKKYVSEQGVESQVTFLGFVSDDKLHELYKTTLALVQPSLSEGFGLTGIEAMAAGVPVLASDIEIFQEIYQDGAEFFDPHSPASVAKAVRALTPTRRAILIATGQKVAGLYSWEKMAKETLAVYTKVYAASS